MPQYTGLPQEISPPTTNETGPVTKNALSDRERALSQEYKRMLALYGDIPTVAQNARAFLWEYAHVESEEDDGAPSSHFRP